MDLSTPAGKVVATLKQQLKAKGLHYRDVAVRMKISERTVKRYFSGRGVTLDVLQELAEAVELDVLSLITLAQQQGTTFTEMTRVQQAALRKNTALLAVFSFLNFGMTPARIAQEFELGRSIELILVRLETLGLIRRYASNGVKILVERSFGLRDSDQMTEQKMNSARRFLTDIDLSNTKAPWFYQVVRLSDASATRLEQMMRRFVLDAAAITKSDIDLPPSETQWYRMFVAAEPISRQKLFPKS